MNRTHAVLVAARALIANPANWTRSADARTVGGLPTHPFNRSAVSFDMVGAILRASWELKHGYNSPRDIMTRNLPFPHRWLGSFNDHPDTTHADVLAVFDRAIEAAKTGDSHG